jgi:two-component system chemotaxis response regulator CheB
MTVRVLIVDDSPSMRRLIERGLNQTDGIEVVGLAADAYEAREQIKKLDPDVITLDILMPGMDGLEFLEKVMRLRPMPVIMCSVLTGDHNQTTKDAMELGAAGVVEKPHNGGEDVQRFFRELSEKVLSIGARLKLTSKNANIPRRITYNKKSGRTTLIAVGSSTGGPEALAHFLGALPPNTPPVVITQHMPQAFLPRLAARFQESTGLDVQVLEGSTVLTPGMVRFAPGDRHLHVKRRGLQLFAELGDKEKRGGHVPAVDVMFQSLVPINGVRIVAVLLTGMGRDGAEGLKALHDRGCITFAQDEATSVVYGMPKAAVELGAVTRTTAIAEIPHEIFKVLSE